MKNVDTLLINPSALKSIYQDLSTNYAAIEPPVWALMISGFLDKKKISNQIIDCAAENFTTVDLITKIEEYNPKLISVVVYGQQPSASTQNMEGASQICKLIKEQLPKLPILMIGSHIAALPEQTLREEKVDFVCNGEGPLTIEALIKNDFENLAQIPGLLYRQNDQICSGPKAENISQADLSQLLPLPWDKIPMDRYRAHNWHCFEHIDERQPYASIYTSLGCPFNCSFCCINTPFGGPSFRYFKPEEMIKEFDILVNRFGIKNIKIIDEMFVLKEDHFLKLCDLLIERNYDLNIWAYSRIDTIKPHHLERLRKAGVRWLVLGIESKSQFVRSGLNKAKFNEDDIFQTVKMIRDAGIFVHGNYIFGLPDDDLKSMNETLDMAMELNTEMANFYCAMAYPGSELYTQAVNNNWQLPSSWIGYSQHSYECQPLPTNHLSAKEVLAFRDQAWQKYFTNPNYLSMIESTFGIECRQHIEALATHKLKRRLLS